MQDTIGVDVSKDRLDAFALGPGRHRSFANHRDGQRALRRWIEALGQPLVVFEPTGPYHRAFERGLAATGLAFVKVNPRQARRFAEAEGRLGKTDRADAASLARMGAALELAADTPLPESLHDLRALLSARDGLIRDRVAASTRARTAEHALLRRLLARRLREIARDLEAVDREITRMIAADPGLARRREVLASMPGIGPVTAAALLILMPELGTLGAKAAGQLAGLAPVTRQSGSSLAKGRIAGGRARLRRTLYMPALAAIRFNPEYHAKHADLAARGKPGKVIVTAIMRKLVVLADALLRDDRMWTPKHA